jgi:hypothetical protein
MIAMEPLFTASNLTIRVHVCCDADSAYRYSERDARERGNLIRCDPRCCILSSTTKLLTTFTSSSKVNS